MTQDLIDYVNITAANVDPDLCWRMASLGPYELDMLNTEWFGDGWIY